MQSDPSSQSNLGYESPDPERPSSSTPSESVLESESKKTKGHDPYAALRIRDYLIFSFSWMVSVIGNLMTIAALRWEIYDITQSKLNLGWIGGIQAIPLIVLALPAGAIADAFDRRRVIAIFAALAAVSSLGFAVMSYQGGAHYLPIMYGLLLLNSTFLVLGRPARSSLLPMIVPQSVFTNAVTWNSSIFQVAAMIGPALGGLIIAGSFHKFHNIRLVYIIDSLCSFGFAVSILMLKKPRQFDRKDDPDASIFQRLTAGLHFVRKRKIILATMTLDLFAVLLGGAAYLLPVFTQDILHVGSVGYGWLLAAEAIGAFTMALLIAHLPPMKRAGRSMLLAVAAFGMATIIFGLSRNFWLSFLALFLIGAFDNISVVVRHTLVQILTPDAMRGRVSAVNNIFIGASNELGGFESGATAAGLTVFAMQLGYSAKEASIWGPTLSVVIGGIGTIIVVIVAALIWPELRKFGRLQPTEETTETKP